MSALALVALQTAVVQRLKGDADFLELAGTVRDAMPENQTYPCVVFDSPSETPDRTFGENGHACSFTLSIYTEDASVSRAGTGSVGFGNGLAIADAALNLLVYGDPLTVTGFTLVDLDVEDTDGFRESDGIKRRVDLTFTALLEDAA